MLDRMLSLKGWKGILFMLGLGGISALSFPPTYCVFILFFTFPALVIRIDHARTWKGAFFQGYWFGFGLHTVGLVWLVNAILIRAHDFWWLIPVVSPLCAVLLALWTGMAALFYYWIAPEGGYRIPVFAGLWTVCDMTRAIVLSPQGWNPALTSFPWNPLGSGWEFPGRIGDIFIQFASVVGVDGLTLLMVALALCPLYGRKGFLVAAGGIVVLALFGWYRIPSRFSMTDVKMPVVVMVQGNIAEDDKIANTDPRRVFQTYMELTSEGVRQAVQLRNTLSVQRPIVFAWPESAFPGDIELDAEARQVMMRNNPEAVAGMIGAVRRQGSERFYNSMVLLKQPDGLIDSYYDKVDLVPFGEFQPWYIPFHVVPGMSLTPGQGKKTIAFPGINPFSPLICYEIIFSGQIIASHERPRWMLNLTNDAWYGDSAGPRQHLAAVRLRAVEEGIPVVRVANTGISAVYDPYGRNIAQIGWGIKGEKPVILPDALPSTIFASVHRLIPLFLSVICILSGFLRKIFRKNYRIR